MSEVTPAYLCFWSEVLGGSLESASSGIELIWKQRRFP